MRSMTMFLGSGRNHWRALLIVPLVLCIPAWAQQTEKDRAGRDESAPYRTAEPSDLAKDNLNRVAASAAQIQGVLLKDAGLLVELKRWVAKEASNNGQVVEDSDLTDQAVFDRLASDVAFRSVATRLLQRYGYLQPAVNPDSDLGKEQDLVLKERARRLVQIESQEDARSLRSGNDQERTASCDPREDENCVPSRSRTPRRAQPPRSPGETVAPEFPPAVSPDQNLRSPTSPRTLRAGGERQEDGLTPSVNVEFAPASTRAGAENSGANVESRASAQSAGAMTNEIPQITSRDLGQPSDRGASKGSPTRRFRESGEQGARAEAELSPVAMVHRANPYADIPSLYDMYVQAASHQRKTERFGLEVFRNSAAEPDAIPMDLPVGPDYVVGPGDGLAIDLWGGVSQRLFRVVDREGRLSLPEVGPLLVSGKTLGDLQQSVQHVLRTQFRDVSADVSLSRLRTVRVYVVGDVAQPGAYDISSLSTPLNALFAAGGCTGEGSLRSLKHFRGKQLIEEIDAYDLLLRGVRSDLKRLENGDTLLVSPIGPQVTVEGMVRRPAIYELHEEKNLAEVLDLAGGILPAAALRHIEVQRLEAHQKRTMLSLDISETADAASLAKQLESFNVQSGDVVHIFPIAPYSQDAVYLQGHVMRPGRYSFQDRKS